MIDNFFRFMRGNIFFLVVLLSACSGRSDPQVSEESLLPARIALQASRVKVMNGFNQQKDSLINNSFNLLTKVESMLKGMNDNKDILIDILTSLQQPFELTSSEPINLEPSVSASTPPFTIGGAGLNSDFLLLSSSSRFLTSKNSLKTRFKTSAELSLAWQRAVEFSDKICVYVGLQSVDVNGAVTNVSNTLVVPLVTPEQCSVQL